MAGKAADLDAAEAPDKEVEEARRPVYEEIGSDGIEAWGNAHVTSALKP
jgi:hypothetical protein